MNTQPEALRLADELEAMFGKTDIDERVCKELRRLHEENEHLRQALAQPEQEPFGYFRYDLEWDGWVETEPNNGKPLYTAPPKREWVGLTDEQRHEFVRNYGGDVISKLALVKAIEAKLNEKNT